MPLNALRALLLAALALLAGAGCHRRPPDVVIVSIDTLRWDHVGFLAPGSPASTPHMDALAADGVVFEQAFSPIGVTGPSFCTLMTGRRPGGHGVVLNLFRGGRPLPRSETTLAERLRAAGWRTAAFVSGFTLRRALGLVQGFEVYDGTGGARRRRDGRDTVRRALRWLRARSRDEPVFLWIHLFDCHGPYADHGAGPEPGPDWRRGEAPVPAYQRVDDVADPAFYAARYARAVEFEDRMVGRIVAALRETGRYRDALVVLHADHGESLAERELWFDHGTAATVEQLRVPLVVKLPGNRRAGEREAGLVGLEDVAPTVLDALGLPPLEAADGRPLLRGPAGRDVVLGESSHCKDVPVLTCAPRGPAGKEFSARNAELAVRRRTTAAGVEWLVYDRRADPAELRPLDGAVPPADLRDALEALAERRRAMALPAAPPAEAPDAGTVEALRALGYLEPGEAAPAAP